VALAQLRRVERKNDGASRPPELFDLKDSGSIENDATSVLMIDRPWIRASTEDRQAGKVQDSEAAIYLKKNRNGATHRKVPIHFDGPCFRMTEAVQERRPWAPNKPGDPRD
jgi:replicative DNA helicase